MKRCRQDLIPMIDVEREGVKGWSRKQVQDSVALFARLVRSIMVRNHLSTRR